MPKLKVRKSAKKRYKLISRKRFLRKKAFKGHLLEKKSSKQKRNLANRIIVNKADTKAIRKMLVC
uniref:50S ribosomal protein L35 n=1 Tax=Ascoseira mirabilis TaxID=76830 RepID=UPI003003763A|nr:50S ribosomal protein L35 [Ascoseira mirabilis]